MNTMQTMRQHNVFGVPGGALVAVALVWSSFAAAAQAMRQIERLGMVQIDSVSAVVRSHYLPLFSRLGPYPPALLDRLAYEHGVAHAPARDGRSAPLARSLTL